MTLRIAAQTYLMAALTPVDLQARLVADVKGFYGRITTIRDADLGDLWELARDLVVSLDRWGRSAAAVPGPQRMAVALEVAWGFVAERGGTAAIRDRIARALPLPDFIERRVLGLILNDERARGLIQFVLELAVREVRKFRD